MTFITHERLKHISTEEFYRKADVKQCWLLWLLLLDVVLADITLLRRMSYIYDSLLVYHSNWRGVNTAVAHWSREADASIHFCVISLFTWNFAKNDTVWEQQWQCDFPSWKVVKCRIAEPSQGLMWKMCQEKRGIMWNIYYHLNDMESSANFSFLCHKKSDKCICQ